MLLLRTPTGEPTCTLHVPVARKRIVLESIFHVGTQANWCHSVLCMGRTVLTGDNYGSCTFGFNHC